MQNETNLLEENVAIPSKVAGSCSVRPSMLLGLQPKDKQANWKKRKKHIIINSKRLTCKVRNGLIMKCYLWI